MGWSNFIPNVNFICEPGLIYAARDGCCFSIGPVAGRTSSTCPCAIAVTLSGPSRPNVNIEELVQEMSLGNPTSFNPHKHMAQMRSIRTPRPVNHVGRHARQVVRGHSGGRVPHRAGDCKFDVAWLQSVGDAWQNDNCIAA